MNFSKLNPSWIPSKLLQYLNQLSLRLTSGKQHQEYWLSSLGLLQPDRLMRNAVHCACCSKPKRVKYWHSDRPPLLSRLSRLASEELATSQASTHGPGTCPSNGKPSRSSRRHPTWNHHGRSWLPPHTPSAHSRRNSPASHTRDHRRPTIPGHHCGSHTASPGSWIRTNPRRIRTQRHPRSPVSV